MTFKVIHRLQAFSNSIRRTFVQHFTRCQLTECSHGSSALAEFLVHILLTRVSGIISERNERVVFCLGAHCNVVILSIAFVSVPIFQVNAQYLTSARCQQVKVVVACTRHPHQPNTTRCMIYFASNLLSCKRTSLSVNGKNYTRKVYFSYPCVCKISIFYTSNSFRDMTRVPNLL